MAFDLGRLFASAPLGSHEAIFQLAASLLAPPQVTYYPTNDLASLLRALAFGLLWRRGMQAQAAQQFRDLILQADPMRLQVLLSDPKFREQLRRAGISDEMIRRIDEIAEMQRRFIEGIAQRIGQPPQQGQQTTPTQPTTTATTPTVDLTNVPITTETTTPTPTPTDYTYSFPISDLLLNVPAGLGNLFGMPNIGLRTLFGRNMPLTTTSFVPSPTQNIPILNIPASILPGVLGVLGSLIKF